VRRPEHASETDGLDFSGEADLRELTEALDIGIIVLGPRAEVLLVNRAARALMHAEQPVERYDFLHGGNVVDEHGEPFPVGHRPLESAITTGEPLRNVVVGALLSGNAERTWYLVSVVPEKADDGSILRVVVTLADITPLRHAETALQASESRFSAILKDSPIGISLASPDGRLVLTNAAYQELLGYTEDELAKRTIFDVTHPDDVERTKQVHYEMVGGRRQRYQLEKRYVRRDGEVIWARLNGSLVSNADGEPEFVVAMVEDITDRKRAEEAKARSDQYLAMQYELSQLLGVSQRIEDVVEALIETVCQYSGWDTGALWSVDPVGGKLRCHTFWQGPDLAAERFEDESREKVFADGEGLSGTVWHTRAILWLPVLSEATIFERREAAAEAGLVSGVGIPVGTETSVHGILEFFSRARHEPDAPLQDALLGIAAQVGQFLERRQVEITLAHQSMHDELTGLPNRLVFGDRVQQALLLAPRENQPFSVLLIDLDHFKEINDTFGHPYGDELLRHVAGRLGNILRESDTIARLGGDEFGLLLPGVDALGATVVASKLREVLAARFEVRGLELEADASVGIVVYPEHGDEASLLLQRADVAMYQAKRDGTGFAIYVPENDPHSRERHALIGQLRRAIEESQLVLHFQPIVTPATGTVTGAEALLRWHHPVRGMVQPAEFIGLAERTGLIQQITVWVLEQALRQCVAWRDEEGLDVSVHVNLSARNLHDYAMVDTIAGAIGGLGAENISLGVEITETTVMADPDRARDILLRLHDMCVKISIDDFGTGYSSLAYLRALPVDEVKIDRTFVGDMVRSDSDKNIVRATIDLAHDLGLKVVAEGVEDLETADMLHGMGCDRLQGFYVSHPLSAADFKRWLKDSAWKTTTRA
jgi:diguanylate cyclase (GGDEF)-like protein/PAS domain S-box-containing protein